MSPIHKNLAEGGWYKLSLAEQIGNIGSEVSRSMNWYSRDKSKFEGAFDRAIELFNLTLADPRWSGSKRKEIARAKESYSSLFFSKNSANKLPKNSFLSYFDHFALAARSNR